MTTPGLGQLESVLMKQYPYREIGRVSEVVGLVIESKGPKAKIGDVCYIYPDDKMADPLPAEVVGFKDGRLLMMPFGEMVSLSPGSRVINTRDTFKIPVGDKLLGRVIDGMGQPIDNRGDVFATHTLDVVTDAPHPLNRKLIQDRLHLGVRSLDGFTTVGKGQRMGIFSGSGVGKSTLLGMIARNTEADMSVIGLIGERGREVREFIEHALGNEGLKRSVVVVATAEQPALMKIKAALVATTVAEYFRNQGKNVLLMLDSLTRVAMALREVGLSVGEPPTSRGYTPSVFAFMPKLLERTGTSGEGSITGLYTVLVEGDDFNEPISDTVRGILDGHIILSRDLAYQNHFPAVDVLGSVSRLMLHITPPEHLEAAGKLRDMLATYKRYEDIVSIGAYVRGTNPKLDQALQLKDRIDQFLRQSVHDRVDYEEMLEQMFQLSGLVKS